MSSPNPFQSAFEKPDEVYEDYGTPAKKPREEPFDIKNLSEDARMLLAPKFRSNIDIRTSEASGTPTTSLNTLANSALLQQAIDDGNVPGVPKGTPLKNLLPGIDEPQAHLSSPTPVLTPPLGSGGEMIPSDPLQTSVEPSQFIETSASRSKPPSKGIDGGDMSDKEMDPAKMDEIMVWDFKDWNVRRTEHLSSYYNLFISPDFIDLWGAKRCPALEKINHPFSRTSPFILYPGKYVYPASVARDERYYIAIEVHYYSKKSKKAHQVLVYIPDEFRIEVPEDAPVEDHYASSFTVLNVNQIDWAKSASAKPAACTWRQFSVLSAAVKELAELRTLPAVFYKGGDMLPSSQQRSTKKGGSRSSESKKDPPQTEDFVATRNKRRRRKKKYSSEDAAAEEGGEDDNVSGSCDGDAETSGSALEEPPQRRSKKNSRSSAITVVTKKNSGGASSSAAAELLPAKASLISQMQPPALPTSASIWPQMIGGSGLNDNDRTWLATEIRRQVSEVVSGVSKDYHLTVLNELRTSADRGNALIREGFTQVHSSLRALSEKTTDVHSKVEEIGGTPSFTWDQIVAQCKQFQEIQMFSKTQDQPPQQYIPPKMGSASSMYYPQQHSLPPQHVPVSFHAPGGYARPPPTATAPGDYGGSTAGAAIDPQHYAATGGAQMDFFMQQYPNFRVKSPSGAPPFLSAVLPGNVQSPMLRRKSLTEEMFQAPHQEQRTTDVEMLPSIRSAGVPSTAAEGGSSQLSRLQQMLPHLSREELEQLIRKNMSS